MTSQRSFIFLEHIMTWTWSWISQLLVPLPSNPRYTRNTWDFTLINIYPSRNMFGTTLPRHFQWLKQLECLGIHLEAFFHFRNTFFIALVLFLFVICKSTCLEITSPWWYHLQIIQAHLLWQPSFSQHILWWCCNPLGILSFIAEILLFNLVFHDGVTPVSISILKPLLRIIEVSWLKPQASPILSICI